MILKWILGVAQGDAEPRPEKDLGDVTREFGYRLTPLMPIGVGAPGHIQTERVPTRVPLLPEHCGDAARLPVLQRHVFTARIHQEVRRISNRRARARGQNHGTSQDTVDVPHVATAGDAGGDVYVCVRIYLCTGVPSVRRECQSRSFGKLRKLYIYLATVSTCH